MSCSFGDGLWYTGSLGRMFARTKLQYYTLVLMYYYWRVLQFNSKPDLFWALLVSVHFLSMTRPTVGRLAPLCSPPPFRVTSLSILN